MKKDLERFKNMLPKIFRVYFVYNKKATSLEEMIFYMNKGIEKINDEKFEIFSMHLLDDNVTAFYSKN